MATPLFEFFPGCNDAAPIRPQGPEVLSHNASRASLTLAAARYIGPGDAALGSDFSLGQGRAGVQPVAQGNNHSLPLIQALGHASAHLGAGVTGVQLLQHIVVYADGVHQREGAAVSIPSVQGVRQGHLPLQLSLGAEVHQDFIFNTPGGIGGQADIFVRFECTDPLDQADGSDGNQVVLVSVGGVVFLGRVKQKEEFSRSKTTP